MYIPGSSVLAASEFILVVDGQVLGRLSSFCQHWHSSLEVTTSSTYSIQRKQQARSSSYRGIISYCAQQNITSDSIRMLCLFHVQKSHYKTLVLREIFHVLTSAYYKDSLFNTIKLHACLLFGTQFSQLKSGSFVHQECWQLWMQKCLSLVPDLGQCVRKLFLLRWTFCLT